MKETFLFTKDSNRRLLGEGCGKQVRGEDVYLLPHSTNRIRNSKQRDNSRIKLGV